MSSEKIRSLLPKEKHIHFLNSDKDTQSFLCTGKDDCPICQFVEEKLTIGDKFIIFLKDIVSAFKKLCK